MRALAANEIWHSDSSYKELSAGASILCAVEIPERRPNSPTCGQRMMRSPRTRKPDWWVLSPPAEY